MVFWNCAVPSCKSKQKVPGHFFPAKTELAEKWKKAIKNPNLASQFGKDLRRYRVCYLHFLKDCYITTREKRRLKHDAVPSLYLNVAETINSSLEKNEKENTVSTMEIDSDERENPIPRSESSKYFFSSAKPVNVPLDGSTIPNWADFEKESKSTSISSPTEANEGLLRELQRVGFERKEKDTIENPLPEWNQNYSATEDCQLVFVSSCSNELSNEVPNTKMTLTSILRENDLNVVLPVGMNLEFEPVSTSETFILEEVDSLSEPSSSFLNAQNINLRVSEINSSSNVSASEASKIPEAKQSTNLLYTSKKERDARPLLRNITRKSKPAPVSQRITDIAEKLNRLNSKYSKKLFEYKQQLYEAENVANSSDIRMLRNLVKTQQQFFEIHLQNVVKNTSGETNHI